jgi:hypothetical protein
MKLIEAHAKHYRNIFDSNSVPIRQSTCLVGNGDAPTHLIHFNGERFLGPYEKGGQ